MGKKTTLDLIDFLCLGKNNNMFIQVLDDIKVRNYDNLDFWMNCPFKSVYYV